MKPTRSRLREPIAIVGMAGRFPGARNLSEFWRNLRNGVESISFFGDEELRAAGVDPETLCAEYVRAGAPLEGAELFDAEFFGISRQEAEIIDPQHRLLLECAHEALEDAGHPPSRPPGPIALFAGVGETDYVTFHLPPKHLSGENHVMEDWAYHLSNSGGVLATRVAYKLDLRGPAVTVQTTCSTSLVAVHLACQALRSGEADVALAGGVCLHVPPTAGYVYNEGMIFSPDGHTRTFDARAAGTLFGSGVGLVVLRRLVDALADGDHIRAVVLGTAINNDGSGPKPAFTAPSVEGQVVAVSDALDAAGVPADTIGYVEAHGTATRLGDVVEVTALTRAFRQRTDRTGYCALGSVKSNIGHAVEAAGAAGLIKTVLMLEHRQIAPSLNFETPNPKIDFESSPFRVATRLTDWTSGGTPRRAGVSSFGVGGTNAHAIVEEAPAPLPRAPGLERPRHLLCVSAKSPAALTELARAYADHLAAHPEQDLADVCFTANAGRSHYEHRLAVVAGGRDELRERLAAWADGGTPPGVHAGVAEPGGRPHLGFVFTGQGAQYVGMARGLFDTQPTFRRIIERCDAHLRDTLPRTLSSVLFPSDPEDATLLEARYLQPAAYAVQCGLAELLRSWGLEPLAVAGHSLGEYAAAWLTGVFSLEDGLSVVAARGRLMQSLPPGGAMASLVADAEAVARAVAAEPAEEVGIAALNAPTSTVVSGTQAAVERVVARLAAQGVDAHRLEVSHAFHSALLDPILEPFEREASAVSPKPPRLRFVSSLTGAAEEKFDARYWCRQVREPVRFADAVRALAECDTFVEIGPRPVLTGLGRAVRDDARWVATLDGRRGDWDVLLDAVATLYVHGADPDWEAFDADYARRRVALPTYPFQRSSYWRERHVPQAAVVSGSGSSAHAWLGPRIPSPLPQRQYTMRFDADASPTLMPHRIAGVVLFPATGFLDLAAWAARDAWGPGPIALREFVVHRPLTLPEGESRTLQVIATDREGESAVEVFAQRGTSWERYATATVAPLAEALPQPETLESIQARCTLEVDVADMYRRREARGLEHGPSWRGVTQATGADAEAIALIRIDEAQVGARGRHALHPVLWDAVLHLGDAALPGVQGVLLPTTCDEILVADSVPPVVWVHARVVSGRDIDADLFIFDFHLYDEAGRSVGALRGSHFHRVSAEKLRALRRSNPDELLYRIEWRSLPQPGSREEATNAAWLVVGGGELGAAVHSALAGRGLACRRVLPGTEFERCADGSFRLDPGSRVHADRLLGELGSPDGPLHVVHLAALQLAPLGSGGAAQRETLAGALHLVQAREAANRTPADGSAPDRLWLVTRGAQSVDAAPRALAPEQAPVWGLGRVVRNEVEGLETHLVDLDPADPPGAAEALVSQLLDPEPEEHVALRGGARYVPHLVHQRAARLASGPVLRAPAGTYALTSREPGLLEQLALTPRQRRRPGPGEVEIGVRAAGLNFRDVLVALGRLEGPLGRECSGTVVACGEGVSGLHAGDAVMAVADHAFGPYVTLDARHVVPKPAHLSHAAAATIPLTFLTALYGLRELARLGAGESVLIHAAAGGVGLAALQLARLFGARPYGTASQRKRHYLRSLGLEDLFDSRTTEFAEELRRSTGGAGVNVVLNSLAGDFIPRSLESLAPGGRFVELGASGIWDHERVAGLRPDVEYFPFQLGDPMQADPDGFHAVFAELAAWFAEGRLRPLPFRTFPLDAAVEAFGTMAKAEHVGKIVLLVPEPSDAAAAGPRFRKDGTYLVTGGLGALGLRVADWLARRGAGHLVLLGRRAQADAGRIASIEAHGAEVHVMRGDVADRADLARVVDDIRRTLPPLRGVMHAAGVLDDGALAQQTWERFGPVLAPKLDGTWNLHAVTHELPLEHFVLFSSVSSLLGSPGQSNYAASNAFLDAFAHYRRSLGLPAVSIHWGPWSEGGMVASLDTARVRRWEEAGTHLLDPESGLAALERVLDRDESEVAAAAMDWDAYRKAYGGRIPSLLAEVARAGRPARVEALPDKVVDVRQQIAQVPESERLALLLLHIQKRAARLLSCAPHEVDPAQPLKRAGLDSLMAIQLRNMLAKDVGVHLPMVKFLEGSSVAELASTLYAEIDSAAGTMALAHEQPVATPATATPADSAAASEAPVPLSLAQLQTWIEWRLDPGSAAYNIAFGLRIEGPFDLPVLERALEAVVGRHEILRTRLPLMGDEPVQVVEAPGPVSLTLVDLSDRKDARDEALRQARDDAQRPFDLERGPVFRTRLFRLAADRHLLTFTVHHACFDGWSTVVVADELKLFRDLFARGPVDEVPDPPAQYRDFTLWQRRELAGPETAGHLAYWRERLTGPVPSLALPADHPRADPADTRGARVTRAFDAALTGRLEEACAREDVTPFVLFLAGFHALLLGLTGQKDQCVGTPLVTRPRAEFQDLIGDLVDTLVLRTDLSGDPTFRELLQRVRETALGAFAHPLPFPRVVQELNPKRRRGRTSLFDVLFQLGKPPVPDRGFPIEAVEVGTAKFQWSVTMTHGPGALSAELEYRAALFDKETVERVLAGLEVLLDAAVRDPGQRLSALPSAIRETDPA